MTKRSLAVLMILVLVFSLFPFGFSQNTASAAATTVDTSTSSSATANSSQRKTFYDTANSKYWNFYHNGSAIEYSYSADRTSWTSAGTLSNLIFPAYSPDEEPYTFTPNTNDFSLWYSSNSVYLAFTHDNSIRVVKGTVGASSITFEQVAYPALYGTSSSDSYSYPYISTNSSGILWVGARYYNGTNYTFVSAKTQGANDNSTWDTTKKLIVGENQVVSLCEDTNYVYAGCVTSPGKVVRISKSDFSTTTTKTFASGENYVWGLCNDANYVYAGCSVSPGKVVRISKSDFSTTTTKTFASGENSVYALCDDTDYVYAACATFPGKVVRISKSDFSTTTTKTLASGENGTYGLCDDTDYVYASCSTSPGKVVRINKSDFSTTTTKTFASGENVAYVLCNDTNYVYAGMNISPGRVKQLGKSNFGINFTVSDTTTSTNLYGNMVSLGSGDMYATYIRNTAIEGKKWTNSSSAWDSSATSIATGPTASLTKNISAVADSSGNVHLVYIDSNNYVKYQEYTTSWQIAVTLDGTATCEYPTISISGTDLYAFWIRSNTIYYKKGVSPYASGNWDGAATTFYNTGTNTYVSSGYSMSNSRVFAIWTNGSASPYDIEFDSFSVSTWNHTTSAATLAPPSVHPVLGNAFIGGNDNYVRGMSTTDGTQAWTPVSTGGAIQSRSPVLNVSISGTPTYVIYSASSDGYLYAINASTGGALSGWPKNIGKPLQAGVAAQKSLTISGQDETNTDDWVLFIGTYDNVNHASNKLYALDAVSGVTLWTQQSINLDFVSSSPCVDSSINTVYFTSYDNSGTQSSLWAVNTADGTVRWSKALGNISSSPTKGGSNIYVATNAGYLYKYPSQTSEPAGAGPNGSTWRFDATAGGVIYGYPWYSSGGKIYFSTTTQGRVYCVNDDGTANTSFGSPNGYVAVTSPSAPLVNSSIGSGKLYVGSTDGKIHELGLSDGVEAASSYIGSTVGSPTYDYVKGYLYVGATDGKIYSFNVASGL